MCLKQYFASMVSMALADTMLVVLCWQATYRKEQGQGGEAEQSDASASDAEEGAPAADTAAPQGKRRKRARSATAFSAEESALLVQLFEKHGTSKGYVDLILADIGDRFKRSQIQRQLKALGLKKGQLTDHQVIARPSSNSFPADATSSITRPCDFQDLLRECHALLQKSELQRLFHAHKGKRDCLAKIVEVFPGQMSKGQIRSQLRHLGLQLKGGAAKEEVWSCPTPSALPNLSEVGVYVSCKPS